MSRKTGIFLLAGVLMSGGCETQPTDSIPGKVTSQDVRRDASKAVNSAVEFSQQAKVDFQNNLDTGLKKLEAEMATLREKGRDLKDDAKTNWDQKMADLEVKRDATRSKLIELQTSSAAAWKDMQTGAQSAWEELESAFRDASREF